MPDKIELNRVRSFGEIIEDSIQFYKQNWKPLLSAYFSICGFFWVASLVVSLFNQQHSIALKASGESIFSVTYFLALGFELLSFMFVTLTMLCFISLYKDKGNEPPTVAEVWGYVKYYFVRALGSFIALGAAIIAGIVCCVIPGIYLSVVFALVFPIMVMENSTLGYAFNRSFQLIKNSWWQTFGVILVVQILIAAAMACVAIPALLVVMASNFLTNTSSLDVYSYATIIITHLLQFLYMLPLIAITLCYFNYTELKDDGALLKRIMMLGKNDTETEQQSTEEY